MEDALNCIRKCTDKSLLIIDELGKILTII
jgi:hypothetical protein